MFKIFGRFLLYGPFPFQLLEKPGGCQLYFYKCWQKKSSCNVNIPDIEDTIQVATEIQSKLGLNTQVCHKLSGNVLSEDYLFFGNYWLEPGDIIEELGFGAR